MSDMPNVIWAGCDESYGGFWLTEEAAKNYPPKDTQVYRYIRANRVESWLREERAHQTEIRARLQRAYNKLYEAAYMEVVRPEDETNPRTVQHTTIGGKGHVGRLHDE